MQTNLVTFFMVRYDTQGRRLLQRACRTLSDLVPLQAVSLLYHYQVLDAMPWWRPPPSDRFHVRLLANKLSSQANLIDWWTKNTVGALVARDASLCSDFSWVVTAAELRRLWRVGTLDLQPFYFAGYMMGLTLFTEESGGAGAPGRVAIHYQHRLSWPRVLTQNMRLDDQPCESMCHNLIWSMPEGDRRGVVTGDFWWNEWGDILSPQLRFDTCEAFVPTPSTTMELKLEVCCFIQCYIILHEVMVAHAMMCSA